MPQHIFADSLSWTALQPDLPVEEMAALLAVFILVLLPSVEVTLWRLIIIPKSAPYLGECCVYSCCFW